MSRLKGLCLIMLVVAGLVLPSSSVRATVDVTTGFASERRTTLISLFHEDVSPMPVLVAELAQNVDAIDNVFHELRSAGRLLPTYPVLVIEISDDAFQRVLSGPKADGYALLSLASDYRLDWDPHDVLSAEAIVLGPVYRIELSLWPVTVNELLTLVHLLPELSASVPQRTLLATDIRRYSDKFASEIALINQGWSTSDLLWSPDGNFLLLAHWHNQRYSYQVLNLSTAERMTLDQLDYYILPPTFSPDSRHVVYSSQTELRIVDIRAQSTARFSLGEILQGDQQSVTRVQFAANKTGDMLFFSLFGWGMPTPATFLWRSAVPGQVETVRGLGFTEKPNLPGETWSDFRQRWHAVLNRRPTFAAELKGEVAPSEDVELAAQKERLRATYGAFFSRVVNHPQNSHLAILVEHENRLEARVLSLPSLVELDMRLLAVGVPPTAPSYSYRTAMPARLPLLVGAAMVLMLLLVGGIAKFLRA